MSEEVKNEVKESKTQKNSSSRSGVYETVMNSDMILQNIIASNEIIELLEKRNLTLEKVQKTKELCNLVVELNKKQKKEYGEKLTAHDNYEEIKSKVKTKYQELKTLAKMVFKNDETRKNSLGITNALKNSFGSFIEQITLFTENSLNDPEAMTKLAEVAVTEEEIKTFQQMIKNLVVAKIDADNQSAEYSTTTKERNEYLKELQKEMKQITTIATLTLKDQPLLMKKLGL